MCPGITQTRFRARGASLLFVFLNCLVECAIYELRRKAKQEKVGKAFHDPFKNFYWCPAAVNIKTLQC
uniref:Putative secreted protein n=1 Tax=Ixodes scapularis TaxID=6945 RepID=A0A4D5RVK2_IXOSC